MTMLCLQCFSQRRLTAYTVKHTTTPPGSHPGVVIYWVCHLQCRIHTALPLPRP